MAPISFVSLLVLFGAASSSPIYPIPLAYVAVPAVPENIYNQVQDTKSGEYAFGYAGGPVAREEAKTSDGVVRGAYSYVDAYGIVQHYRYIADDDGFRVVGTNIPTDETSKVQLQDKLKLSEEVPYRRTKRSAIFGHIPVGTVHAIPAAPVATSSQNHVQIHRSVKTEFHHPVEAIPVERVATVVQETPVAVPVAVKSVHAIPAATSSQSRFQVHKSLKAEIHAPIATVPVQKVAVVQETPISVPVEVQSYHAVPAAVPVAAAASVPVATSSQSRFQVHKSLKAEIHAPIATVPVQKVAVVQETPISVPVEVQSYHAVPAAVPVVAAASVPVATSSQSRFQVHKSLKAEIHAPIATVPVAKVAVVQETPISVPVEVQSYHAVPAAVPVVAAASVPVATSSQSRFQVHKSLKAEIHAPIATVPVQKVAVVQETPISVPIDVRSYHAVPAAAPVVAAASVPVATSSQSRFQVHESLKAEIPKSGPEITVTNVVAAPKDSIAVPIEHAHLAPSYSYDIVKPVLASVPLAKSNQQQYQIHDSSKIIGESFETIPINVAAATSDSQHFQVHEGAKLQTQHFVQSPNYQEYSLPHLAQSQVGVGLGVVSSPFVSYRNYETPLFAEP